MRKDKGEKKRLDLPWFTQKANKVHDTGLAVFTEATISLFPQRLAPSGLYKSVNPFNVDKTPAPNQAGFNQTASSILELSVGERQSHRPAMMVL